ncbi:MAG TPA: hypothetical protein VFJ15_06670 [Oleiagrimonas sp.]|nr:hypothetical protein [Oleiagrimonas sp.]
MNFRSLFMCVLCVSLSLISLHCVAGELNRVGILDGAKVAFSSCDGLQGVHVVKNGKVVCLRGKITSKMFVTLVKKRSEIKQHPYVVVSGIGGYPDSSIYIVRMMNSYEPVAVVGDMCASACAQFLFFMGKRRVLLHCADLVMHGGPGTIDEVLSWDNDYNRTQRIIADMSRMKRFYKDRGISMDMITKPPPDVQKMLNAGKIVFWPWSINKLRSFGVRGIISNNNPDEVVPKDYEEKCLAG